MNKKKFIKLFIVLDIVLIIAAVAMVLCISPVKETENSNVENNVANKNETIMSEDSVYKQYRELYDNNKAINSDYLGQIVFDSGLINLPFVASKDNNDYLRRDFETKSYSVLGTVFMDYECDLECQNIILYGHNAFSSYDAGTDENLSLIHI